MAQRRRAHVAWCLVRQGYDVLVVEPRDNLGDEDYMMALYGAGYDASERVGLARLNRFTIPSAHGHSRRQRA